MKKVIFFLGILVLFNGCATGAGSQFANTGTTNNVPFNIGVSIGKAIGNSLWGGKK